MNDYMRLFGNEQEPSTVFDAATGAVNKPKPKITMEEVMNRPVWGATSKPSGGSANFMEGMLSSSPSQSKQPDDKPLADAMAGYTPKAKRSDRPILDEIFGRKVTGDDIVIEGRGGGHAIIPRQIMEGETNGVDIPGQTNPLSFLGIMQAGDEANDLNAKKRSSGLMNLMNTGKTTGELEAERKQHDRDMFMQVMKQKVGRNATNMGMFERQARNTPGAMREAQKRKAQGAMILDDALALGLRRSRYGDYGTREETVPDGEDKFGRPQTRTRTVNRSPEQWLEDEFNQPQRDKKAKEDAAMMARINEAVGAGTLTPRVDTEGNITGYDQIEKTVKRQVYSSPNGLVEILPDGTERLIEISQPQEQAAEQPLYAWKEGMPSRIMLDKNTLGVVDPIKKYYRPYPIEMKKVQGVDPATGKRGEYMAPNHDTTGLKKYDEWKPGATAAPTDPKTIIAQVRDENPDWTREQIIAEAKRIAGQ